MFLSPDVQGGAGADEQQRREQQPVDEGHVDCVHADEHQHADADESYSDVVFDEPHVTLFVCVMISEKRCKGTHFNS